MTSAENKPASPADHLINTGAALGLAAAVYGGLHPLSTTYPALLPNTAWGLLMSSALILSGGLLSFKARRLPQAALEGWFAVLLVVLLSDVPTRWPTLYHGGLGILHIALAAVIAALALPRLGERAGLLLWLLGAAAGYAGMAQATQGQILFSDDHPAFLYRLAQLKAHFPNVPFYNPMWNGGVEAREFFPSGMLNVFFMLFPVLAFVDLPHGYTELVALLFFIIHPACAYLAVRVLKLRAPLAPLLALFTSVLWFRYQFIYGTLGFLTSTALSPLVIALLIRAAEQQNNMSWKMAVGLVLCSSLFMFWTPAALIILPALALLAFPLARFVLTRKGAACACALVVVNLPWLAIFIHSSQVMQFIATPQSGEQTAAAYPSLSEIFFDARYALRCAAPALLILALPGLLLIRKHSKLAFRTLAFSIAVLFAAGLLIAPFKPRLELERLLMVALYLCTIPAACALNVTEVRGARRLLYAGGIGSVLLIPAVVYVFAANRALERYSAFSPELPALLEAISLHHDGGRIAFSGYIHHQLDGGHVTPLPLLTGVPLYASRYQHDRWDHEDFIPTQFRREHDAGIEKFFDLYNITAIAVHDPEWGPWFSARPAYYTEVWRGGKFVMFKRRYAPKNWFLQGSGKVLDQTKGQLRLTLESPTAVLRFNWLPFLEVEGCGAILPFEPYEGIRFIHLTDCKPGREIVVRAKSALRRMPAFR